MRLSKKSAASLSIISNSVLIIFKLTAGIMMNSVGVISEAIHSSIDLIASFIAFFSIRKSIKEEDEEHPFGHGKYENVSGFAEAILILFAAAIIIYEAVNKIVEGVKIESVGVGIVVMIVATIANFIISRILLKVSKETNSIALEADGMHLLTDVLTSCGVLGGLVLIKVTGIKLIDPIIAVLVAILIGKTSIELIKKSMIDLVDSKLPDDEIDTVVNILNSREEIESFHKLRTRKSGNTREIDIHVIMSRQLKLYDAHKICNDVEKEIQDIFPGSYVVIHVEPDEL